MARHRSLAELVERHREAQANIDGLLKDRDRKKDGIAAAVKHLADLRDARLDAEHRGDTERARELDKLAAETVAKIAARRDERQDISDRVTELERADAIRQARIEKRRGRKDLDKPTNFDTCSVPRIVALVLLDCRENGWGGRLNSGDRTPANCDRFGDHSSQAELWAMYQAGTGAPANPPAAYCSTCGGTHEYRADGKAYAPKPRGAVLAPWQLGLDLTLAPELATVAARLGYHTTQFYSAEIWHRNLTQDPTPVLVRRGRM